MQPPAQSQDSDAFRQNMHRIDATWSKQLTWTGLWAILVAIVIGLTAPAPAGAQSGACQFTPDDRNPPEQILRCGASLTVRQAAGTSFHAIDQKEARQPEALQLDEGALLIEFHARPGHSTFQILTPQSIAAVRGTKWAVEVGAGRSSTFVISGVVAVSRPGGHQSVFLRRGEGADVSPDSGPIVVKRWAAKRVQALLARFGE